MEVDRVGLARDVIGCYFMYGPSWSQTRRRQAKERENRNTSFFAASCSPTQFKLTRESLRFREYPIYYLDHGAVEAASVVAINPFYRRYCPLLIRPSASRLFLPQWPTTKVFL